MIDDGSQAMATAPLPEGGPSPTVHLIEGNRLRLLRDGPAGLEALLALIAGARETLDLLYYIFWDNEGGQTVLDAIVAARRRGVAVRLVVDGFGSKRTVEGFFDPLREAGGAVCRFNPDFGRRYVLRNHQKMAIADGSRAVIGGFNISLGYFDPNSEGGWRDLGLQVEGPAVSHLSDYYGELHSRIVGKRQRSILSLRKFLKRMTQKEGKLRWVFGGPGPVSPYARQVRADLRTAKSLSMMMGYFAPNRRMARQLRQVSRRGGEARIITAGKTDLLISQNAARATYRHLLKYGVQIAEYSVTRLHAKLIVLDDATYIGSGNFDIRSLYINLEVMLRIEDAAFAAEAKALFDADFAVSDRIDKEAFRRQATWLNRLRWSFAYFMFTTVDLLLARRAGE